MSTHIKNALPAAVEVLARRRQVLDEIRPGLLADVLNKIDQELEMSRRRETSRKQQYLARGRAKGLIDAMGIAGFLNKKQLEDWTGYVEGCVGREFLLVDHEEEERREIDEFISEIERLPDDHPDRERTPVNLDDVPF